MELISLASPLNNNLSHSMDENARRRRRQWSTHEENFNETTHNKWDDDIISTQHRPFLKARSGMCSKKKRMSE
jgi:hypothetical protein